jgi:putative DNA primase/helicase
MQVFQRGQSIVRPCTIEVNAAHDRMTKSASLHGLTSTAMVDTLDQVAFWGKYDGRSKSIDRCDVPRTVADIILSRVGMWKLPKLLGIITTPTLRRNGDVLASSGYDEKSRLYLETDDSLKLSNTVYDPSRADADAALKSLEDLIAGFPFTTPVSKAVALSAILTALVRGTMGNAPLHAFRANTAGTGKSYLADVVSTIATGRLCPVMGASKEATEIDKRITSVMLAGYPLSNLDNINGELSGDLLCQAVERPLVSLRIYGKTEMVDVENSMMLIATGNNLRVSGDMCRRTVIADLDAEMEKPECRQFDFDPVLQVLDNRSAYVSAALTIMRYYILEGRPDVLPRVASFEHWSDNVRSALVYLGCEDPAKSMELAREDDPELESMRETMALWLEVLGAEEAYTVKDVIAKADEMTTTTNGVVDGYAYPELREALHKVGADRSGKLHSTTLGYWLRDHAGRIVNGHRFKKAGTYQRAVEWQLAKAKPAADNVVNISDYQSAA